MSIVFRGAALALLVGSPLLGAAQQTPSSWPKPGQLVNEGVALHDKEDYAGAIAKYQAVTPGDSSYALAQSELALSLHSAGKHEEAVAAARRALALQPFEPQTYNTLANAQEELKQIDEALATYKQALHLFPYNQSLYFNQGVTHVRKLHTAEALTNFQHSLELSPLHPGSHRLLALLAAEQGQTAHALISWLTFLMLTDNSATSHGVLVEAERLAQGLPVVPENEKAKPIAPNAAFADLDQLLESKVALQKSYVSKVKFPAALVKQTQLLVEKFPVDGPADDFWVRTYGPMVAALRQGDNLTTFTYLILQSAENQDPARWVKANKGKVEAMLHAVLPPLVALRTHQQVVGGAPGQRLDAWYSEGKPEGLGTGVLEKDGLKHTGDWISLNSQGAIDATGSYNAAGQRIGTWKVLRPDGSVEKTFIYNDKGEREGMAHEFFPSGQPSFDIPYHADKIEGVFTVYNECGARTGARTFKAGDLEGPYTTYFDNGQVSMRANAHADKVDGVQEGYFANGALEYTTSIVNGVKEGPFTTFYSDKTPHYKGSNDKDEHEGPYTEYHPNGAVSEEGRYNHGKRMGTWHTYFDTGKPSVEKSYDEAGELHGIYHDYDETGHLFSDIDYVHGRTVRLRYYDKAGKLILDEPIKKGHVTVQALDSNGAKAATGTFEDGQMAGEWQWFYPNGDVREITHYNAKGDKDGSSEYFFHGGQVQRRLHFGPDGSQDGRYEQYSQDGQLLTSGYYLDGARHGQWKDYRSDGRLSEEYEYYKGESNGPARSYEPSGKLTQERVSEFGKLRSLLAYDSVGQVISRVELKPDSKELVMNYPSGKPLYRTPIICYNMAGTGTWLRPDGGIEITVAQIEGHREGPYRSTYADGKPRRVGQYHESEASGAWTTYYPNGQLHKKGSYRSGDEEGEWTVYFPNGQVEFVDHYLGGELHGSSRRFNPAGELLVEKNYEHGELISFRGPAEGAAPQPLVRQSGAVAVAFANGKPAVAEKYEQNLPAGTATFYYASGEVFRRTSFAKGLRTGLLESFYPGGKRMEEEHYLHGELNGLCRYYRPDGTLEREETYRSGEKHGPTTYFDAAGKPQRTEVYWDQQVYDKK